MAVHNNSTIPGIVEFVGEIRQTAEHLTVLKDNLNSLKTRWDQIFSSELGTSAGDSVDEGRTDAPQLTAANIASVVTQVNGILSTLNTAGVDDVLELACIRSRRVRD